MYLDESLSGGSVSLVVIDKVNSRLQFLHKPNRFFLTLPLRRRLCNALTQPLFCIMPAQLGFQIFQRN